MKYTAYDVQLRGPDASGVWETVQRWTELDDAITLRDQLVYAYNPGRIRIRKVTITEVYETVPVPPRIPVVVSTETPEGTYRDSRGNAVIVVRARGNLGR